MAETVRERLGTPLRPADRDGYEADQAAVRTELGEAAFEVAWEDGRAMTLEQAIVYALEAPAPA